MKKETFLLIVKMVPINFSNPKPPKKRHNMNIPLRHLPQISRPLISLRLRKQQHKPLQNLIIIQTSHRQKHKHPVKNWHRNIDDNLFEDGWN